MLKNNAYVTTRLSIIINANNFYEQGNIFILIFQLKLEITFNLNDTI